MAIFKKCSAASYARATARRRAPSSYLVRDAAAVISSTAAPLATCQQQPLNSVTNAHAAVSDHVLAKIALANEYAPNAGRIASSTLALGKKSNGND
jgi:hypothetical protein